MGKLLKKGERGKSSKLLTRTQAIKKLQVSFKAFRRLCILKGIYPREAPSKLKKKKNNTYYHVKDILFLQHDPMIQATRDHKVWKKKLTKAKGRRDFTKYTSLFDHQPLLNLDPVIKDRYPSFHDALADLDDHLNILYLFASFPHGKRVPTSLIEKSITLAREWEGYLIMMRAVKKVFISLKGIYFQAQVCGQTITWLAPHHLGMRVPNDVDLPLMMTFLQFAQKLQGFINFRLYHSLGLLYPPTLDSRKDDYDSGVSSFSFQRLNTAQSSAQGQEEEDVSDDDDDDENDGSDDSSESDDDEQQQKKNQKKSNLSKKSKKSNISSSDDDDDVEDAGENDDDQDSDDDDDEGSEHDQDVTESSKSLINIENEPRIFDGCKFFVSREVPRTLVEFVIRAQGGQCVFDIPGQEIDLAKKNITHYIIDRPRIPEPKLTTIDYVQPQWIFDSVNADLLLPIEEYAPGVTLPPHLSPFVDDEKMGYLPERAEQIKKLQSKNSSQKLSMTEEKITETLQLQEQRYQSELDAELGVKSSVSESSSSASSSSSQPESADQLAEIMIRPRDRWMYGHLKRVQARKKRAVLELTRKRALRTEPPQPTAASKSKQQRKA